MLNLKIQTVPDDQQRYNTVGDYYLNDKGERIFVISDMRDWRYEILTAVHELVESALCKHRGVTDEQIDAFDLEFSEKRATGDVSEPGDSPEAPYYREHQFSNKIEKMLADELKVDWEQYGKTVDTLMRNTEVI
ncbi:MAG: hypothetical protein A2808_03305 [Candidatus Moranbacteria bacterium RIFCSPHIGHO2_01_FULL_55_24]|nr:MAG: hypothetical protein A2808_03305 [Candidatus Moranbacteria bacterium RIFCSPHIGHO2_01_FULL_55_24]